MPTPLDLARLDRLRDGLVAIADVAVASVARTRAIDPATGSLIAHDVNRPPEPPGDG